ncbi:CotH kinase family protein [Viscerimonas tarda]
MKKTFTSIVILFCLLLLTEAQAQSQRSNIPTLYITTDNGKAVTSKDVYQSGKITIKSSTASDEITNVVTEIRGRGNSTWNMAKKTYRLKLDKKTSLFGLPAKEKNWVLLANYADKTLMRNAVAFKISKVLGLEFTPSVQFVDLILNNEYQGNYMLTDQVEVADKRVAVEKLDTLNTTLPLISGGYLLEIDGFAASEPVWFSSPRGLKVTIKYPKDDEINSQQRTYITNYIRDFENKLFSSSYKDPASGYRALVDTTSLVNWYIACELTGNSDSFWSTYIYKKREDPKIYFGPLWDYDIAFNNDSRLGDATQKLMRSYAHAPRTWIEQMWKDEWFQKAVERQWLKLIDDGLYDTLISYIDETSTLLQASQQLNFQKWKILNTTVYREIFVFPTYKGGVDYLKKYIQERIAFLSKSFIIPEPEKPSEPFVAENFYYLIMNKRSNNVIDITNESMQPGATLMLWEPNEEDETQRWKIDSLGNGLFRIINKQSELAMTANGRQNNLKQMPPNNSDNAQKWKIIPVLTGNIYGIVNLGSGYSINNSGGSLDNGTAVIEYDNNIYSEEKTNQHWYLQKMEKIGGDPPMGIRQPEIPGQSAIYPTLINHWLTIKSSHTQKVYIYDSIGRVHYSGEISEGETVIDMSRFLPGVYIVKTASAIIRVIKN